MLDSQKIFFESIETFHNTIKEYPELLNQNSKKSVLDNRRALFISCWFAISTFNSLETFLKKRFEEISSGLWDILTVVSFSDLGDSFKKIYTEDAIIWISKYLSTKHHNHTCKDKINKIEDFSKLTSNFFSNKSPSSYWFWYNNSNILYDEIEKVLRAFWITIQHPIAIGGTNIANLISQEICKAFWGITPAYREMYSKVGSTRHKAAHNWYEQIINQTDVEKSLDYIKRMWFLFDVSISFVISQMKRSKSPLKELKFKFDTSTDILEIEFTVAKTGKKFIEKLMFIYLDADGNGWKYWTRKFLNKEVFIESWLLRKSSRKVLLVRNSSKEIIGWFHNL